MIDARTIALLVLSSAILQGCERCLWPQALVSLQGGATGSEALLAATVTLDGEPCFDVIRAASCEPGAVCVTCGGRFETDAAYADGLGDHELVISAEGFEDFVTTVTGTTGGDEACPSYETQVIEVQLVPVE